MPETNLREELAAMFEREIAPHVDALEEELALVSDRKAYEICTLEIDAIRAKLGLNKKAK